MRERISASDFALALEGSYLLFSFQHTDVVVTLIFFSSLFLFVPSDENKKG